MYCWNFNEMNSDSARFCRNCGINIGPLFAPFQVVLEGKPQIVNRASLILGIINSIRENASVLESKYGERTNLCQYCGYLNFRTSKFCGNCGSRLRITNEEIFERFSDIFPRHK